MTENIQSVVSRFFLPWCKSVCYRPWHLYSSVSCSIIQQTEPQICRKKNKQKNACGCRSLFYARTVQQ